MNVMIKTIKNTGKRFVPKNIIGKIGKFSHITKHHGETWHRVYFTAEKPSFAHFIFGPSYFDFLPEEIEFLDEH